MKRVVGLAQAGTGRHLQVMRVFYSDALLLMKINCYSQRHYIVSYANRQTMRY